MWSAFFEYIFDVWKHTLHFYILVSISALVAASVVSTRVLILSAQINPGACYHLSVQFLYKINFSERSHAIHGFTLRSSIFCCHLDWNYVFLCSTFAWAQLISIFICNPITIGVRGPTFLFVSSVFCALRCIFVLITFICLWVSTLLICSPSLCTYLVYVWSIHVLPVGLVIVEFDSR